jgi:hypothetical protein
MASRRWCYRTSMDPGSPTPTPQDEQGQARARLQAAEVTGEDCGFGRAVHVDDHPQWSGAVATEERRGVTGQRPSAVARRAQPGAGGSGSTDEWTAATVGVQCRLETLSPSWGRQCSSRSSRSGAADSEQPRQINGEGGGAAAPAQWPGGPARGSGSGSARRMGSDDSRGTWANGDTPRHGASRA